MFRMGERTSTKTPLSIERAKEALKMLLKEANTLRICKGKPFVSKKDIRDAWKVWNMGSIYSNDILDLAEKRKFLYQPQMGFAEVNRIINDIIPQERTGIKIRSMQWVVSKSVRKFIYALAQLMENDDWLIKNIEKIKRTESTTRQ